jgi:glyoxylate reductase
VDLVTRARRPRIFVTQPIADSALARLRKLATIAVNKDSSKPIPKSALLAGVRSCDILFSLLHDKIDRAVIEANPRLRMVASMSITPDNTDVAAATAHKVPVTVVPALAVESTADIAFALLLAVARRVVEGDRMVRKGGFPGAQSALLLGGTVSGKTIGLVGGKGRIGRAVARRAQGFGMRVLYWGPRRMPEADERALGMTYAAFDDLLKQSDFVSLHSAMKPETFHQIGARELKLMKRTAFLINTARGPVVDEAALTRALKAREIAGAGLDVFEREPKIEEGLRKLTNVVMTPHLGSASADTRDAMANTVVDNIEAFLAGRRPPNIVNPEVL